MATKIFVNLPVKDLKRSTDFFTALGFRFDPQFTDNKATCMVVSEEIFVMLLTYDFFKSFTKKELPEAGKTPEVILAISRDSRADVDHIISKAMQSGGNAYGETQDHGWMYVRGFQDPDGHLWEFMYLDPDAVKRTEATASA
jgi:uncharacterized protein